MKPFIAGHLLQLAGYGLVFMGMGTVVIALMTSTSYPQHPLWMFLAIGGAIGAPMMIVGSRYDSRGRALLFDLSPEETSLLYRQQNQFMLAHLTILWLQGFWVALPIFFYARGWIDSLQGDFVKWWIGFWMMLFCMGRAWITRPLLSWVARRIKE